MSPAVSIRGLHAGYRGGPNVVRALDLELAYGECVAVLGESGAGKSTLLKVVAGLVPARAGRVETLGHAMPRRPPRGTVGYVPQRLGLVRHATVFDNVAHGGLHETTALQSFLHHVPAAVRRRAWDALAEVGLEHKAHEPVHRLSGGQQRRTAVARTLVQRPRVLLADEFLGELDPRTAGIVAAAVRRLCTQHGTAVLFVEHRIEQARAVADRVLRMQDGRLLPTEVE